MSDATPSGHPDASTIVAQSLATVGYAMFSLCRSEPLAEIPSFGQFMSHVDEQAQHAQHDYDAEEPSAFGESTVDESLAAATPITNPTPQVPDTDVVLPAVAQSGPASVASAMLVLGPDGLPVAQPVAPGEPEPEDATKAAPASLPEYSPHPGHSMAALNEISFLDE